MPGGQGRSWRVGDVVLKPADRSADELEWEATALGRLTPSGFRVALPRRARDGRVVVDGWHATEYQPGERRPRSWAEILDAGAAFHRAVAGERRPAFVDRRTHRWAVADRVAWGELPVDPFLGLPLVAVLARAMRPLAAPSQLVHGDLGGNVLLADGLPPAIIDMTLYWRPAAYASAIVIVDALAWEDADEAIVALVRDVEGIDQHLIRALLFRLLAEREPAKVAHRYAPVARTLGLG